MMYVQNSPNFQYFISIYSQNSVKILTNPYTWRHWLHTHLTSPWPAGHPSHPEPNKMLL